LRFEIHFGQGPRIAYIFRLKLFLFCDFFEEGSFFSFDFFLGVIIDEIDEYLSLNDGMLMLGDFII